MRDELDIPMPSMGPGYRSQRQRERMDPNTRRLMIIAGSIGGALLLLVGGWSLSGRHRGGVPVIEADSSPLRVKPANPGGLQVTGDDQSILSGSTGSGAAAALAPPSEVPAPQALKAQEIQAQTAATAPPSSPTQVAPAPTTSASQSAPVEKVPAPVTTKLAAASVRPGVTAPSGRGGVTTPSGHGPLIQLAALTSEESAKTEWARLERKYPDLLSGRQPQVTRLERDGKVFWRLRTGGFADVGQAKELCERIKAKGAGCTVAAF
jgi:hypothetical protein